MGVFINLKRLLRACSGPTGRALEALVLWGAVPAVFPLLLVPGQALWLVGAEILALGFADRAWVSTIQLGQLRNTKQAVELKYRVACSGLVYGFGRAIGAPEYAV